MSSILSILFFKSSSTDHSYHLPQYEPGITQRKKCLKLLYNQNYDDFRDLNAIEVSLIKLEWEAFMYKLINFNKDQLTKGESTVKVISNFL